MTKPMLPFFLLLFVGVVTYAQDTLRVPSQFSSIQEALDAADANSVILVAAGIYYENLVWPVSVKGIDLISEEGRDSTTINGENNGRVIYKETRNETGSVIRGFEITNGIADKGGGIYIDGVGTDLDNLYIHRNKAGDYFGSGGGVYLESYAGSITNCRIWGNTIRGTFKANGGGLYVNDLDGDLYIENSSIVFNSANGGNSSNGGGAFIFGGKHLVSLTDVSINNNTTLHNIWARYAGVRIQSDRVRITSCRFTSNTNDKDAKYSEGGGLTIQGADVTIEDCEFSGNIAEFGSAILIQSGQSTEPDIHNYSSCTILRNRGKSVIGKTAKHLHATFSNCLIADNGGYTFLDEQSLFNPLFSDLIHFNHITAYNNGDGLTMKNGLIHVTNSIVWNKGRELQDDEFMAISPGTVRVNSSIVRGGYPGASVLDIDPLLDNFYPLIGSPALSYGNPAFAIPSSINGIARPMPINTLPDIGAIEVNQPGAKAQIRFFYDDNGDGNRTMDEPFIGLGNIAFEGQEFVNFTADGLVFSLDLGEHDMNYVAKGLEDWILTTPASYVLMVTDSLYSEEILFGLSPKVDFISLSSYISMDAFRCGERIKGTVAFQNKFKLVDKVILYLEVDERIEDISLPTPDIIDGNTYGWEFTDILPLQESLLDYTILVPEVMNASQVGEPYFFKSWLDIDVAGTTFEYVPELRCSYDPNDKNVNDRDILKSQLNNTLLGYRIRFQNTGNDYARDVLVVDTLTGDLDLNSFDVIGSSHPENLIVTVTEDSIFSFLFKEIFLIDSLTNPELSNGYIDFTVKPLTTLDKGHEIKNTAHIVFDSNPPIITNTIVTTITTTVSTSEIDFEAPVEIFPNPATTTLNFDPIPDYIKVFDRSGRILIKSGQVETLDVSELESGIYLIQMKFGDNGVYTESLFIE